jgi:glycosyltransferase involved in cell wall biosynthesis
MEAVKGQLTLIRAFLHLVENDRRLRQRLRLIIIGDGSLRRAAVELLRNAHAENLAWLPGERTDVPEIMKAMDLFVLPSVGEGISNTILEAMATGLPTIATDVGGNSELVEPGVTGTLIPHSDPISMAEAIRVYNDNPAMLSDHGRAGLQKARKRFSMSAMVTGYLTVYDALLRRDVAAAMTPETIPFRKA